MNQPTPGSSSGHEQAEEAESSYLMWRQRDAQSVKFAATLKGRAACARAKNIAEDVARE